MTEAPRGDVWQPRRQRLDIRYGNDVGHGRTGVGQLRHQPGSSQAENRTACDSTLLFVIGIGKSPDRAWRQAAAGG
ncbi:MAG: hypothetical protein M3Q42_08010 [Pseudomonadota bacterium]|nr:hypothetical protein [Pseudomonadota bacterium]